MLVSAAVFSFVPAAFAQNHDSEQNKSTIAAGEIIYNAKCSPCHGDQLVSTGQTFDLRRLTANDRARFNNAVRNGKNQMPPWRGVLSDDEIDLLWSYVRTNAYEK
jgi:mono/diheme cytochrome c family protein